VARGVRTGAPPARRRRPGKSERPDRGSDLGPPPVATGADADRIIDTARRATIPRSELSRDDTFEELSPDVGELDEDAVRDQLAADPDATLSLLADMARATDTSLRALARELAARIVLDLAREQRVTARGIGRMTSRPFEPEGDLDLDASLDALVDATAKREAVDVEALRIRTWAAPSTAWCLLVDRSGSMHGEPVATAALAAAAVALRGGHDCAVLSFGRDVVACTAMWEHHDPDDVVDRVLALRGHGTTDVAAALLAARSQLDVSGAQRRVAILLSDCRATEPGDVYAAARSLDELVIVAPEGDAVEAAELADAVGARWTTVAGPSAIVAALGRVLDRR
jgi:Mg-chelatase subunit ChlD